MSLLIGLIPSGCLFDEVADSSASEYLLLAAQQKKEQRLRHLRTRQAWKYPKFDDSKIFPQIVTSLKFDDAHFDNFLYQLMTKMLFYGRADAISSGLREGENDTREQRDTTLYDSLSFVLILRLIQRNSYTAWEKCLESVNEKACERSGVLKARGIQTEMLMHQALHGMLRESLPQSFKMDSEAIAWRTSASSTRDTGTADEFTDI